MGSAYLGLVFIRFASSDSRPTDAQTNGANVSIRRTNGGANNTSGSTGDKSFLRVTLLTATATE